MGDFPKFGHICMYNIHNYQVFEFSVALFGMYYSNDISFETNI